MLDGYFFVHDVLSLLFPHRLASICLQEVAALKNHLEAVIIPAAKKAEFRARLGELQVQCTPSTEISCFLLSMFVRTSWRRVSLVLINSVVLNCCLLGGFF